MMNTTTLNRTRLLSGLLVLSTIGGGTRENENKPAAAQTSAISPEDERLNLAIESLRNQGLQDRKALLAEITNKLPTSGENLTPSASREAIPISITTQNGEYRAYMEVQQVQVKDGSHAVFYVYPPAVMTPTTDGTSVSNIEIHADGSCRATIAVMKDSPEMLELARRYLVTTGRLKANSPQTAVQAARMLRAVPVEINGQTGELRALSEGVDVENEGGTFALPIEFSSLNELAAFTSELSNDLKQSRFGVLFVYRGENVKTAQLLAEALTDVKEKFTQELEHRYAGFFFQGEKDAINRLAKTMFLARLQIDEPEAAGLIGWDLLNGLMNSTTQSVPLGSLLKTAEMMRPEAREALVERIRGQVQEHIRSNKSIKQSTREDLASRLRANSHSESNQQELKVGFQYAGASIEGGAKQSEQDTTMAQDALRQAVKDVTGVEGIETTNVRTIDLYEVLVNTVRSGSVSDEVAVAYFVRIGTGKAVEATFVAKIVPSTISPAMYNAAAIKALEAVDPTISQGKLATANALAELNTLLERMNAAHKKYDALWFGDVPASNLMKVIMDPAAVSALTGKLVTTLTPEIQLEAAKNLAADPHLRIKSVDLEKSSIGVQILGIYSDRDFTYDSPCNIKLLIGGKDHGSATIFANKGLQKPKQLFYGTTRVGNALSVNGTIEVVIRVDDPDFDPNNKAVTSYILLSADSSDLEELYKGLNGKPVPDCINGIEQSERINWFDYQPPVWMKYRIIYFIEEKEQRVPVTL